MKNTLLLFALIFSIGFISCSSDSTAEGTTAVTAPETPTKVPDDIAKKKKELSTEYPTVYKEMSLPQLPEGTIMRASPVDAQIEKNVTITIKTEKTASSVKEYFNTEMDKLGWEKTDIKMQSNEKISKIFKDRIATSFTKEGTTLFLSANQRIDGETYVNLRLKK